MAESNEYEIQRMKRSLVSTTLNFFFFVTDWGIKNPFQDGLKLACKAGAYEWVETNPSNIRIFPTDICIILMDIHFIAWWYYTNSFYRCCWMLDGLVSSHPEPTQGKQHWGVPLLDKPRDTSCRCFPIDSKEN